MDESFCNFTRYIRLPVAVAIPIVSWSKTWLIGGEARFLVSHCPLRNRKNQQTPCVVYYHRWEIECSVETDCDGLLFYRETYGDADGYMFDPREVFQGEGGGIGGRGGGLGDGTIRTEEDRDASKQDGNDPLDPDGFFEREKR